MYLILYSLIKQGYKQTLEQDDLWPLTPENRSENVNTGQGDGKNQKVSI